MQIDMHFYGTYAMARAAGIDPAAAETIAHAAQFVDDALDDMPVALAEECFCLPAMTSHKPFDYRNLVPGSDAWRVWVCFHFLPGNRGDAAEERMVCRPGDDDNEIAKAMLDFALENRAAPHGLHLAGVAAHVFADTWAHYGFSGLSSELNRVRQSSIQFHDTQTEDIGDYIRGKARQMWRKIKAAGAEVAELGHGAVATLPDRPYLKWSYAYENSELGSVTRSNPDDYLEACRRLHGFFTDFANGCPLIENPGPAVDFSAIKEDVAGLLANENSRQIRSKRWRQAIAAGVLFSAEDTDQRIEYEASRWDWDRLDGAAADEIRQSDACLFMEAARAHRHYMLDDVLCGHGLAFF